MLTSRSARAHKLLRDHVTVGTLSLDAFVLHESSCGQLPGAVAVDDTTNEVVGIFLETGDGCDGRGAESRYARADVEWSALQHALEASDASDGATIDPRGRSENAKMKAVPLKPAKSKPVTDYGAACNRGTDCAAGVCAIDHNARDCSRTCHAADRCPAEFQCRALSSGVSGCVRRD